MKENQKQLYLKMWKDLKNGQKYCAKRSKILDTSGEMQYLMREILGFHKQEEDTLQSVFSEECCLVHNIYGGFKEKKIRVFMDYSPTIRTPKGGGHQPLKLKKNGELYSLTPKELEKIMGFPQGWTDLENLDSATQLSHKSPISLEGNYMNYSKETKKRGK